jgi:signal peptidase I
VTCPQCGHPFPINCSDEVEHHVTVVSCTCPNCLYPIEFDKEKLRPDCTSGDRVLVAKFLYDTALHSPQRFDVVVFKYPDEPQEKYVPKNYIKRLVGLPGETVGILHGDLYQVEGLEYPVAEDQGQGLLRKKTYDDNARAVELLRKGGFKIIRKAPDKILALRRLVYDNDHQAKDLVGVLEPRWRPQIKDTWKADDFRQPRRYDHAARSGNDIAWLRYRHLLRGLAGRPALIMDNLGYNTAKPTMKGGDYPPNWAGDLILECEVIVEKPEGELVFELGKGVDRFQAQWDLATGTCTLWRLEGATEPRKLASKPTALKKGTYQLRLANVDQALHVWVDGDLPFDQEGVTYEAPAERGPTENDLQPARIGVRGGAVSVQKLQLWRDTYYTTGEGGDAELANPETWTDPERWHRLKKETPRTFYVQPGHFFCLGDNSSRSSDGRTWGLVPEQLLLGRALLVFYPFSRIQVIR